MKTFKNRLIDFLAADYSVDEAIDQINTATITFGCDELTIEYDNGVKDVVEELPDGTIKLIR